jgi:alkaline phosphatase D
VDGLQPGHVYHYRFLAGGVESPVGRARTAPAMGASTASMRFAFCSCQNYEDGYYTAYRHMAAEDLDLVLHLGDYIYEGGISRNAVRPNQSAEVYTLDEYRARHFQYRSDPDLQAAHAAFSWVVTWDDHDVDNNYAGPVPQDEQDLQSFLLRRAAAYQAYYEFMPLRRRSVPRGPHMGLYRRVDFGDLVSLNVLDTRQYRDDQACGDRFKPDCDERFDASRSLLGADQERWLLDGLRGSEARWNVLAQQVMMAPLENRNGENQRTHSMDTWDGYPGARQRVLDVFASGAVASPVVLTGDIHSSWVADLHVGGEGSPVVGTELVGTSITTNGDGDDIRPDQDTLRERNPHFRYHDERRGYVRCDVTPERLTAYFRGVPFISRPGAPLQTRAVFVVDHDRPGAVQDV